jgi:hypothetical protein
MALAVTSTKKTVFGNKRVVIIRGTAASGDTSGTVVTGLSGIDYVEAHWKDLADKTIQTSESGGTVTLTFTDPAATKIWELIVHGY